MQETNKNNFSQEPTIDPKTSNSLLTAAENVKYRYTKELIISPKTSNCPQTVAENIKHRYTEDFVSEQQRRGKSWPLGRLDAADCEIRKTDITIYEDGHFKLHVELHDHGTIFGDHFDIDINLWGPFPHDELITKFNLKESLGAGDDVTIDIESIDPSPKIKDNFDRIEAANRNLGCSIDT